MRHGNARSVRTAVLRGVRGGSLLFFVVLALGATAPADPPPGYYDSAVGLSGEALRLELHEIVDDHTRFPYTSSATDTWDIVAAASEDPGNPANVLTIYRNKSADKDDHTSGTGWNREHSWPNSYGFSQDGSCNYPYTDCHQLFPADWGYNSSRGNNPYDDCLGGCASLPVDGFPAEENLRTGSGSTGTWEAWDLRKGDVARAILYLDVRYEGGVHGTTSCTEPDLRVTDDRGLIVSNSGSNFSPAYMGVLSTLLDWHLSDPPDDFERDRNDVIFSFQGNRNPFVDHPEWVCEIWTCSGSDTTPPAPPTGLVASGEACGIDLDWLDNSEPDLAGYHVERAPFASGPWTRITTSATSTSAWFDPDAGVAEISWYRIFALDVSGNESAAGTAQSGFRPDLPCEPTAVPWVNEIHYDNSGTDANEGVEIACAAGTDLTDWVLVGYNGANGLAYDPQTLSGTIADQSAGFGTRWFAFSGLQNGSPDGLALVDPEGVVVWFLGYEGSFLAVDGPASGMTSENIGVSETSGTPLGHALQLAGTGAAYDDFAWMAPSPHSRGLPNPGQVFEGPAIGRCQGIDELDVLEVRTGGVDVESGFRVVADAADSLEFRIVLPPAGGNGKFVAHLNAGAPTDGTLTVLPAGLGTSCFDFLLPPFGDAAPVAVWNRLRREAKVGSSQFFGDPIPNPSSAPTTFYFAPSVDVSAMPPGTEWTLQAVILNPDATSRKGASVTDAIVVDIR